MIPIWQRIWCIICENQLTIAFRNELNVRQPQNLALFQYDRAADTMNIEHTHIVGVAAMA